MIENIDFDQMAQDVIDGNESPIRGLGIIDQAIKHLKQLREEVFFPAALDVAMQNDKQFYSDGFNVERRNGRRIYDYTNIPEWVEARRSELKKVDKRKLVESKYKRLGEAYGGFNNKLQVADENGEIMVIPLVSHAKDSLILKEAK